METTMDSAGRVVIPKEVRRQASVQPGVPLEARYEDGKIVLEPKPMPVHLVRRGRFTVAVPAESAESLTSEVVESTRKKIRGERSGGED